MTSAQSRLEACYEAMQADNPRINAVLDVFNASAIEAMLDADQRLEAGALLSPIDGMPIGVKANIAVAGEFFHGGIKAYASRRAEDDAAVTARLRAAGAIITGTLNMEEGALGAQTDNPWFGKTLNPLSNQSEGDEYTPGGSSGGSAAAVAAGFCEAALGTDTMGSVRIPSAYCGLFGFKPSHDAEMLNGVMPLSETLDTVGVHARDLDTTVAVMTALLGRELDSGETGAVRRLDWGGAVNCEPDVARAFCKFADPLGLPTTDLGPYDYGRSRRAGLILSEVEGYAHHARRLKSAPTGFSDVFRGMLEYGRDLPRAKIDAAYAHVREVREASGPDYILMPTAPQTAFQFGSPVPANQADFTAFANLADRPAVQFPIGNGANGLPIGAQLVGRRGDEPGLVATLRALINQSEAAASPKTP